MSLQTLNSRLVRWSLRLQEFDLRIQHKSGKTHLDGDYLSRFPPTELDGNAQVCAMQASTTTTYVGFSVEKLDMEAEQSKDPAIVKIIAELPGGKSLKRQFELRNGVLYRIYRLKGNRTPLLVVPKQLRLDVLEACHDDKCAGHLRFKRTSMGTRWPDWLGHVKSYVESCIPCQTRNVHTGPAAGPLQPFCSELPLEIIATDVMGPLP